MRTITATATVVVFCAVLLVSASAQTAGGGIHVDNLPTCANVRQQCSGQQQQFEGFKLAPSTTDDGAPVCFGSGSSDLFDVTNHGVIEEMRIVPACGQLTCHNPPSFLTKVPGPETSTSPKVVKMSPGLFGCGAVTNFGTVVHSVATTIVDGSSGARVWPKRDVSDVFDASLRFAGPDKVLNTTWIRYGDGSVPHNVIHIKFPTEFPNQVIGGRKLKFAYRAGDSGANRDHDGCTCVYVYVRMQQSSSGGGSTGGGSTGGGGDSTGGGSSTDGSSGSGDSSPGGCYGSGGKPCQNNGQCRKGAEDDFSFCECPTGKGGVDCSETVPTACTGATVIPPANGTCPGWLGKKFWAGRTVSPKNLEHEWGRETWHIDMRTNYSGWAVFPPMVPPEFETDLAKRRLNLSHIYCREIAGYNDTYLIDFVFHGKSRRLRGYLHYVKENRAGLAKDPNYNERFILLVAPSLGDCNYPLLEAINSSNPSAGWRVKNARGIAMVFIRTCQDHQPDGCQFVMPIHERPSFVGSRVRTGEALSAVSMTFTGNNSLRLALDGQQFPLSVYCPKKLASDGTFRMDAVLRAPHPFSRWTDSTHRLLCKPRSDNGSVVGVWCGIGPDFGCHRPDNTTRLTRTTVEVWNTKRVKRCDDSVCKNGQCEDHSTSATHNGPAYTCRCFDGWTGTTCERRVDKCQADTLDASRRLYFDDQNNCPAQLHGLRLAALRHLGVFRNESQQNDNNGQSEVDEYDVAEFVFNRLPPASGNEDEDKKRQLTGSSTFSRWGTNKFVIQCIANPRPDDQKHNNDYKDSWKVRFVYTEGQLAGQYHLGLLFDERPGERYNLVLNPSDTGACHVPSISFDHERGLIKFEPQGSEMWILEAVCRFPRLPHPCNFEALPVSAGTQYVYQGVSWSIESDRDQDGKEIQKLESFPISVRFEGGHKVQVFRREGMYTVEMYCHDKLSKKNDTDHRAMFVLTDRRRGMQVLSLMRFDNNAQQLRITISNPDRCQWPVNSTAERPETKYNHSEVWTMIRASCATNPCRNQGTCVTLDEATGAFECQCTANWTGPTCDTQVRHCNVENFVAEDIPSFEACPAPLGGREYFGQIIDKSKLAEFDNELRDEAGYPFVLRFDASRSDDGSFSGSYDSDVGTVRFRAICKRAYGAFYNVDFHWSSPTIDTHNGTLSRALIAIEDAVVDGTTGTSTNTAGNDGNDDNDLPRDAMLLLIRRPGSCERPEFTATGEISPIIGTDAIFFIRICRDHLTPRCPNGLKGKKWDGHALEGGDRSRGLTLNIDDDCNFYLKFDKVFSSTEISEYTGKVYSSNISAVAPSSGKPSVGTELDFVIDEPSRMKGWVARMLLQFNADGAPAKTHKLVLNGPSICVRPLNPEALVLTHGGNARLLAESVWYIRDTTQGGYAGTCYDGVRNGGEEGVDCGGSYCRPCPVVRSFFSDDFNRPDGPLVTFDGRWFGSHQDTEHEQAALIKNNMTCSGKSGEGIALVFENPRTPSVKVTMDFRANSGHNVSVLAIALTKPLEDFFKEAEQTEGDEPPPSMWFAGCVGDDKDSSQCFPMIANPGGYGFSGKYFAMANGHDGNPEPLKLSADTWYRLEATFSVGSKFVLQFFKGSVLLRQLSMESPPGLNNFQHLGFIVGDKKKSKPGQVCMDNFKMDVVHQTDCPQIDGNRCPAELYGKTFLGVTLDDKLNPSQNGVLDAKVVFDAGTTGSELKATLTSPKFSISKKATVRCLLQSTNLWQVDFSINEREAHRAILFGPNNEDGRTSFGMFVNPDPTCLRPSFNAFGGVTPDYAIRMSVSEQCLTHLPHKGCPGRNITGWWRGIENNGRPLNLTIRANGSFTVYLGDEPPQPGRAADDLEKAQTLHGQMWCSGATPSKLSDGSEYVDLVLDSLQGVAGLVVRSRFIINPSFEPHGVMRMAMNPTRCEQPSEHISYWGPGKNQESTNVLTRMPGNHFNAPMQPNCYDGKKNGDEAGVDCGGTYCVPCLVESVAFQDQFTSTSQALDTANWDTQFPVSDWTTMFIKNNEACSNTDSLAVHNKPIIAPETVVSFKVRGDSSSDRIAYAVSSVHRAPEAFARATEADGIPVFLCGMAPTIDKGTWYWHGLLAWQGETRGFDDGTTKLEVGTVGQRMQYTEGRAYLIECTYRRGRSVSLQVSEYDAQGANPRVIHKQTRLKFDDFQYFGAFLGEETDDNVPSTPDKATCMDDFTVKVKKFDNVANPCDTKPCQFGGTCVASADNSNYKCECPEGRRGITCAGDPCPAGTMANPSDPAGSCVECPVGFFNPSSGGVCRPCPRGSFGSKAKATQCNLCAEGQTSTIDAQTSATGGSTTTVVNTALGITNCTDCPVGRYAGDKGSPTCLVCGEGFFNDKKKQSSCFPCPIGSGTPPNGDRTKCEKCPLGRFSNQQGKKCEFCPAGTYASTTGLSSCVQCAVGKFSSFNGAQSCRDCPPGQFAPEVGAKVCTNCPIGTYKGPSDTKCEPCPNGGTTEITGALFADQCIQKAVRPQGLKRPLASSKSDTAITWVWGPPDNDATANIFFWVGVLSGDGRSRFEQSEKRQMTFEDLTANTKYEFFVIARNPDGFSDPSPTGSATTTAPAPKVVSMVASDPDNGDSTWGAGDIVTITFDVDTNKPAANNKTAIDAFITFDPPIGSNYQGEWTDAKTLVITILAGDFGNFLVTPYIGLATGNVRAAGNVRTAAGNSAATHMLVRLTGNWGVKANSPFTKVNAPNINEDSSAVPGTQLGIQIASTHQDDVTVSVVPQNAGSVAPTTFKPSALAQVQFTPASNFNGDVSFKWTTTGFEASSSVKVVPINDPPVLTVPSGTNGGAVLVPTGKDFQLKGISIADVDAVAGTFRDVIACAVVFEGTAPALTIPSAAKVDGVQYEPAPGSNAAQFMVMYGKLASVNQALQNLTVNLGPAQAGQSLRVFVNDLNNGANENFGSDRFGSQISKVIRLKSDCSAASPPTAVTARMSDNYATILVTLSSASAPSASFFKCSDMFVDADTFFGEFSFCVFGKEFKTITIFLGIGARVSPVAGNTYNTLTIKANVLKKCPSATSGAAQHTVNVIEPANPSLPTVRLRAPLRFGKCDSGSLVMFAEARNTGTFGRNVTYTWTVPSAILQKIGTTPNDPLFVIDGENIVNTGDQEFSVTVTNFAGKTSEAATATVNIVGEPVPELLPRGPASISVRPDAAFGLRGEPKFSPCFSSTDNRQMEFSWSMSPAKARDSAKLAQIQTLLANTDAPGLLVPGGLLSPSTTYTFTLQGNITSRNFVSTLKFTVKVLDGQVLVKIANKFFTTLQASKNLTLDGSASIDENTGSGANLTCSWACKDANKQVCQDASTKQSFKALSGAKVTVTAGRLESQKRYQFTLTCTAGSRSASRFVYVELTPGTPPLVRIRSDLETDKINTDARVRLFVQIEPPAGAAANAVPTIQWTLSGAFNTTGVDLTKRHLVLNPTFEEDFWQPGDNPTAKVEVTFDGFPTGRDEATAEVNSPPTGGKLSVSPTSGTGPFGTDFKFSTSGWTDSDGDRIFYEYYFKTPDGELLFLNLDGQSAVELVVNSIDGSKHTDNKVTVGVLAIDENGAFKSSETVITVTPNNKTESAAGLTNVLDEQLRNAKDKKDNEAILTATLAASEAFRNLNGSTQAEALNLTAKLLDSLADLLESAVKDKAAASVLDAMTNAVVPGKAPLKEIVRSTNFVAKLTNKLATTSDPKEATKLLGKMFNSIGNLLKALKELSAQQSPAALMQRHGVSLHHARMLAVQADLENIKATDDVYQQTRWVIGNASTNAALLDNAGDSFESTSGGLLVRTERLQASQAASVSRTSNGKTGTVSLTTAALAALAGTTLVDVSIVLSETNSYGSYSPPSATITSPSVAYYVDNLSDKANPVQQSFADKELTVSIASTCSASAGCTPVCYRWDLSAKEWTTTGVHTKSTSKINNGQTATVECQPSAASATIGVFGSAGSSGGGGGGGGDGTGSGSDGGLPVEMIGGAVAGLIVLLLLVRCCLRCSSGKKDEVEGVEMQRTSDELASRRH